jgi:hypothetical protein
MRSLENRLAAIGYRVERPAVDCWRVERIRPPPGDLDGSRATSAPSSTLSLWLDRLREQARPSAYRICLASEAE